MLLRGRVALIAVFVANYILNLVAFEASALEPITGAFGYQLGEVFDTSDSSRLDESLWENSPYVEDYRVTPPAPVEGFNHYDVRVTKDRKEITAIKAWRVTDSEPECDAILSEYVQALELKYGQSEEDDLLGRVATIKQGRREISLVCNFSHQLRLMYRDVTVFDAARERMIKKKVDSLATDGL